jgi:hypothetical protein
VTTIHRLSVMLLGLAVLGLPMPASAQTTEPLAEQARQQAAQASAAQAPIAPRRAEPAFLSFDRRPRFRFGDDVKVELTARVQGLAWLQDDTVVPGDEPPLADRISVPRRRVGVVGEAGKWLNFQVERDINQDGVWRDVYADVRFSKALRVRVGQFKVPFSLEQLTSAYDLEFIRRAPAARALAPLRSVGVMAHGRVANALLEYEAAVIRSDASLRVWEGGTTRSTAGRLIVAPLRDGKSRGSSALRFSVAALVGTSDPGRTSIDGDLIMGRTFFEPMFINGANRGLSAAVEWDGRLFSARGEGLQSTQQRIGQALDGSDLSDLIGRGWYATGTWHAIRSRRRMGRLDLAMRIDSLSFGSAGQADTPFLNPRADHVAPIERRALTGGANLYLSRWIKVQANTVREELRDPLQLLPLGPGPFWSTQIRLQFVM